MASSSLPTVEAKSLSTINFLAANPPQYPNNPTQKGHESLTLYISRVPGTRDIILSTLRPRRRVLTGEDVANSLYYVHLDHPDDPLIAPPRPIRDDATPRSSGESQRSGSNVNVPIKRKPLPANARVAAPGRQSSEVAAETASLVPEPLNLGGGGSNASPAARGDDAATPVAGPSEPPSHPSPPSPTPAKARPKDDTVTAHKGVRFLDVPIEIPQTSVSAPSSPQASKALPVRPHPQGPRPLATTGLGVQQQEQLGNFSSLPPPPVYSPSFEAILPPSRIRAASPPEEDEEDSRRGGRHNRGYGHQHQHQQHARGRGRDRDDDGSPARPPLPPRPRQQEGRHGGGPPPSLPPRPDPATLALGAQPFSLSLIRRDPTTGNQWNVGKVASVQTPLPVPPPQDAGHAHGHDRTPQMGQPINILIESSGYAKFRGMPSRASLDSVHRLSASSLSLPQRAGAQQQQSQKVEEGFQRQVLMSYTKGLRAGLKEKLHSHAHRRAHSSSGEGTTARGHGRQDSMNSVSTSSSTDSNGRNSPPSPSVIMHPSPGYRAAGYTFMSPWEGRCEFRTGNAGRSLKLRHVLPEAVATGDPDPIRQVFGPGAAPISELRFNLPGAELFAPGSKRGKIARDAQSKFNKYIRKQHGGSGSGSGTGDEDEWEDWEEMEVGKEDAGGGNRGKNVKMGKLIVHDEGIKMLDLVVAANVGVWWSAWERTSWEKTTTTTTTIPAL